MEDAKQEFLDKMYRFDWKRELRSCFFRMLFFFTFLWFFSWQKAEMIEERPSTAEALGEPFSLVAIAVIAIVAAVSTLGVSGLTMYFQRTQKSKLIRFTVGLIALGIVIASHWMLRTGKLSILNGTTMVILIPLLPLLSEFVDPIWEMVRKWFPKSQRTPLERGQMPEKGWWNKYE